MSDEKKMGPAGLRARWEAVQAHIREQLGHLGDLHVMIGVHDASDAVLDCMHQAGSGDDEIVLVEGDEFTRPYRYRRVRAWDAAGYRLIGYGKNVACGGPGDEPTGGAE